MLRPLFLLTALCLLFSFGVPNPAKAIDILVLPSVIDPDMDAWRHVPANSEPALYPTTRLYRGQPFRLLLLGKDYATDTMQQAHIVYSVQIFDPAGAQLLARPTSLELYRGEVSNTNSLLLSRQYMTLDFSETDPFGLYRFEITAHDLLADLKTTSTASVELAPFSDRPEFETIEQFSDWLSNYYRAPDPARAVTALLQYVETDPESRLKQAPLLNFLTRVFEGNPFLWPRLKALYVKGDSSERKKILLLAALSRQEDEAFISSLEAEFRDYYRDAEKINLPVPAERPMTEIETDLLWSEFMATGTISPIRKMVRTLHLESTKGAQDKLSSGEVDVTPELKANAALEAVYQSVLISLIQNGERHSLVKQYLGYIYDLEQPDLLIKAQLEGILEILKRRSNEEEARKHMEKQSEEP